MSSSDNFMNKSISRNLFTLNFKLFIAVVVAGALALGAFFISNLFEGILANDLYLSEEAKSRVVNKRYADLSEYIDTWKVKATDTDALKEWIREESYTALIVYDNKHDLFSGGYVVDTNEIQAAEGDESNIEENKKDAATADEDTGRIDTSNFKSDLYNRIVHFADGEYFVYINVYKEKRFYRIMDIFKVILAATIFVLALLLYNTVMLRRISQLSDDVRMISEGDLKRKIEVGGHDEIRDLADSVENMKTSIQDQMGREKAAWDANSQLVTAMSHDIRTPLTSLIGYLDIIESGRYESEEELHNYISSCGEKALQLKELSDKLFRYFLVFGNEAQDKQMEIMDAGILFQQILMEHIAEAVGYGFEINLQYNIPEDVMVEMDVSSLRRLFDNLFSNIMKYADKSFNVEIKCDIIADKVKLVLQNHIASDAKMVESTKIGVKTCKKICEDLHGSFHAMEEEKIYTTEMLFPLVEKEETDNIAGEVTAGEPERVPKEGTKDAE